MSAVERFSTQFERNVIPVGVENYQNTIMKVTKHGRMTKMQGNAVENEKNF